MAVRDRHDRTPLGDSLDKKKDRSPMVPAEDAGLTWINELEWGRSNLASGPEDRAMDTIRWVISTAPEIFLLLAIALGTLFGRLQFKGFSVGATACTLVAAVLLGLLGNFVIPPLFKSIFFSLFVFTIGYKSGPEFFASLSLRTLSQVAVALVVSATGLTLVLVFAFAFQLDPGTAAGLASGSLTQSSMIGTASSALAQLGLTDDVLRQ